MLLSAGTLCSIGTTAEIVDRYLSPFRDTVQCADLRSVADRRGSGEVKIVNASLMDHFGNPCSTFQYGDDICVEFTLERMSDTPQLISVVWVHTATGTPVLHLASHDDAACEPFRVQGTSTVQCVIRNCQLYPGTYSISLWIVPSHHADTDFVPNALTFRVEQGGLLNRGLEMSWRLGVFHCDTKWRVSPAKPRQVHNGVRTTV